MVKWADWLDQFLDKVKGSFSQLNSSILFFCMLLHQEYLCNNIKQMQNDFVGFSLASTSSENKIEKLLDQCVDCGVHSSIRHAIINVLLILL